MAALLLGSIDRPAAVSAGLVISQVYGGGGNSGAPFTHDFVELHNRSAGPIPLTGLSIQYASGTGTGNFGANSSQLAVLPDVSLAPGGYFLVQLAGGATGAPLPAPDFIDADGPINMSATAGKVALVTGAATLGCNGGSAPCTAAQLERIIDLVGYGNANFFESAATAAPSNATAVVRTAGNVDTDNNAADFVVAPPAPRNGGGVGSGPTISIEDAAVGEGNGLTTLRFTLRLSAASASDVTYSIATQDESATAGLDYEALSLANQVIPAGSLTATHDVTIFGDTTTEPAETFAVELTGIAGAAAGDVTARGTIINDDFPLLPIHELQGEGEVSPFANTDVATRGIVTARKINGFFVQSRGDEADDRSETSDALFVFTGTLPAVSVGDEVRVGGRLVEFRGGGAATPGTLTELTSPGIEILSSGNSLPAPVDLAAVLAPPASFASRAAQLERYEGMLVSSPSLDVVGPTNTFGELFAVVSDVARPFREPGVDVSEALPVDAPAGVPRYDGNFERLMVDTDDLVDAAGLRRPRLDLSAGTPTAPVRVRNVSGPLDYAFDSYRVAADTSAVGEGARSPAPVPAADGAEFTIASLNLENFRDGTPNFESRMQKATRLIAEVLRAPDVLGLIEVGDLEDLQELAALINAAAGTSYQAYLEDGDGQSTGFEQNIGYLVNDARAEVIATAQVYQGKTFEFGGQVDLLHDRPPFVLEARVRGTGTPVTVVLNHLRSLIDVNSNAPLARTDGLTVGQRVREKRRLQAEDLADLIAARIDENLVVLGDMNAFEFNDGLVDVTGTLSGAPAPPDVVTEASVDRWDYQLVDLASVVPPQERYSYVFEGTAQVLDHVLVNQRMLDRLARFVYARNNADFPESFESDFASTTRLSDHDAAVAYFGALADLAVAAASSSPVAAGGTVTTTITLSNALDTSAGPTLSVLLPPALTWAATTAPAGWTCSTSAGLVTCEAASLESGATAEFEVVSTVGCGAADGSTLAVTAAVGSATPDANASNNTAAAASAVTNPAPAISGAAVSRTQLLLPLHQMVPIDVTYTATDTCGLVTTSLSVASDEPVTGPGQGLAGLTSPDWVVLNEHHLLLRAERLPRGDGRIYTITIRAVDQAGGATTRQLTVAVPR